MIPLEDTYIDVLKKASLGKSIGKKELAKSTHLKLQTINQLFNGTLIEPVILKKVCAVLDLNIQALENLIHQRNTPHIEDISGLKVFRSPFQYSEGETLFVNNYILYDTSQRTALLFDTGTDFKTVDQWLTKNKHSLRAIFITHNHRDHIYCLNDYMNLDQSIPVYSSAHTGIQYPCGITIEPNKELRFGPFNIKALETPGHTRDGVSFQVKGLERDILFVGDAIFAASQGGIMNPEDYTKALEINRRNLLSLKKTTLLAPGHGPLSTIGHERLHNPFYANFFQTH